MLWSYEDAAAEARFIAAQNARFPGRQFAYDPKVFARYCNMQANSIAIAGWILTAQDILQSRDIANPSYREETRNAGGVVRGVWAAEKEDYLPDCAFAGR